MISELIENDIENYKHLLKSKNTQINFSDIDTLIVDHIKHDDNLPDLVLVHLDEINNERLV